MPKNNHKRRFKSSSYEDLIDFAAGVFVRIVPSIVQLTFGLAGAYCLISGMLVSGGLAASAVLGVAVRGGRASDP
jgi:hypothetical protein